MKKLTLLFAALVLSFTAQATIINGTPNPGEFGRLRYWVHTVANAGDTIVLADGTYEEKSVIDFTEAGIVVMAAEGAKPVVKTIGQWMVMNITATTTFEGIVFDAEAGTDGDNQYGFNISANTTFNNCKFQDYTKYAVTLLAGTTTFDNCVFDGAGVTPSAIVIDGTIAECSIENSEFKNYKDYNISVEDNTTIATLTIDQCVFDGANTESVKTTKAALFTKGIVSTSNIQDSEFKNFAECAITVEKWYGGRFDALTINNCLIHDCTQSAIYLPYAIDTNEKQTCSDFKLTNSTIYNIGNGSAYAAIDIKENSSIPTEPQAFINHLTIYNIQTSSSEGAITIANASKTTISNCIIASPEQKHIDSYNVPAGATIQNSLVYNHHLDDVWTSIITNADPMFVDAANANFDIYANSPAVGAGTDGSNLGDPRWGVKAGLKPGAKVLSKAVAAAEDGATITLGDGIYEESSSFSFDKEGLTIVAAEGTKPVVKSTNKYLEMAIAASTTFKGITFDGDNTAQTAFKIDENTAKDIKFIGCEFKNFSSYCITLTSDGHVDELMIDDCLFHDCGAAVYMRDNQLTDAHTCTSFKMTNSTAYNFSDALYKSHYESELYVAAIEIAPTKVAEEYNEVLIDHVTLYNVETNSYEGGFKVGANSNATISNCIAMDPEQRWGKLYRAGTGATITNSLYFNAEPVTDGTTLTEFNKADPMFVDAANGNFQLFKNSPAVGTGTADSNLGDPRWGVSNNYKGVKISIDPGQTKLNSALGYSVNAGDTIVLKDGIYEEPWTFNLDKEGLVIMAAENAKPIIKLTNGATVLNIQATTTFNGITFDAGNVANYILATTEATSGTLTITNCEFKNWAYWAISNKSETAASIEAVIIDNCLFHDGAEAAIYFSQNAPEGKHACNYFKMTNSTIYNVKSTKYAGIVHVSSNAEATGMQNKVIIDHVTMYNLDGADLGIIAVRKSSDLTISNTIIANPAAGERASYVYGGVAEKVIYYNVSQDGDLTYTNCLTDDPLFVDAANNNFMLQLASPAIGKATDGSNLGDPRWGVEEPTLITLTTGDNSQVITDNIGKTVNVKIARSFKANDGYYTLCVPFNMPASVIGTVYEIDGIEEYTAGQDGGLSINLDPVTNLLAGVPYLVEPKENMNELVVEGVIIANDKPSEDYSWNNGMVKLCFQGCYSADGKTDGATEYYIGNGGYLYNNVVDKRGLCGFLTITDNDDNPVNIRARVVTREEVETGLDNNQLPNTNIQKVLENGQLIIIRDGVKYNVQGQKL